MTPEELKHLCEAALRAKQLASIQDHIEHTIPVGGDIYTAAKQMASVAKFTGRTVLAPFNSLVLIAEPGDKPEDVTRSFDLAQRASYFGGER